MAIEVLAVKANTLIHAILIDAYPDFSVPLWNTFCLMLKTMGLRAVPENPISERPEARLQVSPRQPGSPPRGFCAVGWNAVGELFKKIEHRRCDTGSLESTIWCRASGALAFTSAIPRRCRGLACRRA